MQLAEYKHTPSARRPAKRVWRAWAWALDQHVGERAGGLGAKGPTHLALEVLDILLLGSVAEGEELLVLPLHEVGLLPHRGAPLFPPRELLLGTAVDVFGLGRALALDVDGGLL